MPGPNTTGKKQGGAIAANPVAAPFSSGEAKLYFRLTTQTKLMFIGHFAMGLAAKKADPQPSLGTYFLAAQLLDLIWPLFLLAGIETVAIDPGNTAFTPLNFTSYPYSHSLQAAIVWGALLGGTYFLLKRSARPALLLGLLVVSHWVLDFITHRPDLPLGLNEATKVGLGLWNQKAWTIAVELLLLGISAYLYTRSTRPLNRTGRYAWWGLLLLLLLIYKLNTRGNPPPSVEAIGYAGLAQWLFVLWGYWIDRNRRLAPEV